MTKIYVKSGDDLEIDYDCEVVISGGYAEFTGGTQTVTGQTGGIWWAYNDSSQTVTGQKGGFWFAHNNSSQTVTGQKGGDWFAYDESKQITIR